ncbi:LOW QUALITY PROTEIN: uncharacterized protein ACB058_018427 [Synchiropus picturatus]
MMDRSFLFLLTFLITSIFPSDAQVVIGVSSSFTPPGHSDVSSPEPTKQVARFRPSLLPRTRSDVPIRSTSRDQLTLSNSGLQGQRNDEDEAEATVQSVVSAQTLISEDQTGSMTDTAILAVSESASTRDMTTKGAAVRVPTSPSTVSSKQAVVEPVTVSIVQRGAVKETERSDYQGLGSGSAPTSMFIKEHSTSYQRTTESGLAQYRPQTEISESSGTSTIDSQTPDFSASLSEAAKTYSTPTSLSTQASAQSDILTVHQPTNTPSTEGTTVIQRSAAVTSLHITTTTVGTSAKQKGTGRPISKGPKTSVASSTAGPGRSANQLNGSTTTLPRRASSLEKTSVVPATRMLSSPASQDKIQRNRSVLLSPSEPAPDTPLSPSVGPTTHPASNGTLLYWGDLSKTLAFAWELHVYGSASLFLLLFAGAALGLILSPAACCPHRGALGLANAFLFLAGGLRGALFVIDPYGTRKILPHQAVAAIYNLPLHLLVWTQAALAILALRAAGVSVLPSTLERPPLIAVLAVLQCTLLLAADLFSPALSPLVPVTLQVLSLCWGLGLCFGYLCCVFPRTRCPPIPRPDVKVWTGNRRVGVILGRVLAVCAIFGVLCCGLHVHATLWLYGLLGDWTRFNWGWWLVHFWARLLELSWGFCLLLMGSWVLWRPQSCRAGEEGRAGPGRTGDVPSPGQSVSSAQRHTCWSKIVQSLRGKPCRKSESNGVGGGAGGAGGPGEVPNNWAGQERAGADISKSLIRNENHQQPTAVPRCVKDSNRGRNRRGRSAERGVSDGSTGSLLRLQALSRAPQHSVSGSLEQDRDTTVSLYDFDLRPPSPIDLTRSIDEALHREHLLEGGSLFHPLNHPSQSPSPGSGVSHGPWHRRNSDPQLSESSEVPTESSMPLGGSVLSSVPSRQVTAPPTPSHQSHRWSGQGMGSVPSSVSCPVSLRPSRTSTGHLMDDGMDDTRPFITPDSDRICGQPAKPVGSRSYLEVSRHDDSSSEIIHL